MSWTTSTLGSLVERDSGLIQTGPFGSQLHQSDYVTEGIPAIMPKDIVDGRVDSDSVARVSEETALRLRRHQLKPRTIVLPRRGEITKRAFIRDEQTGWLCGTGCLQIVLGGRLLLPEFLYYYMEQPHVVHWLEQHAVGTTMLNLNTEIVASLSVRHPAPDAQQRIADILSSYDDLIENNRRRMALLEAVAQQLYHEWFVRLRFPGYEHTRITNGVPKGWERVPLGDRVTLNYGKALKAEDRVGGPYSVYGSSGVVGSHAKALTQGPGIIVGRKGNVGSVYWSVKDYWPIDTVYFVDAATSNLWLYYALQHMHFMSTDVAVPGLNRDFAYSRLLLIPPGRIVRDFLDASIPLHEQKDKLNEMNEKLRAARDLLLPTLMSGEIVV